MTSWARFLCPPYIRAAVFFLLLSIAACSPQFDWREVHGEHAPFTVLMPDKPSHLSRKIQLGDKSVTMHMTATRVGEMKFAVGAVQLPDATQAQTALALIQKQLIENISGTVTQEKISVSHIDDKLVFNQEFNAMSSDASRQMAGRLVAHDDWAFEVLVVGPSQGMMDDVVHTFLESFKPR